MRDIFSIVLAALAVSTFSAFPSMARPEPEWTKTEVYQEAIVRDFNQCIENYRSAGANITNGVFLSCLPSNAEAQEVLSDSRPVSSMVACVNWSLAFMGGVINSQLFRILNSKTSCRTEGVENRSLLEMLGSVMTSEIEPYGI